MPRGGGPAQQRARSSSSRCREAASPTSRRQVPPPRHASRTIYEEGGPDAALGPPSPPHVRAPSRLRTGVRVVAVAESVRRQLGAGRRNVDGIRVPLVGPIVQPPRDLAAENGRSTGERQQDRTARAPVVTSDLGGLEQRDVLLEHDRVDKT